MKRGSAWQDPNSRGEIARRREKRKVGGPDNRRTEPPDDWRGKELGGVRGLLQAEGGPRGQEGISPQLRRRRSWRFGGGKEKTCSRNHTDPPGRPGPCPAKETTSNSVLFCSWDRETVSDGNKGLGKDE